MSIFLLHATGQTSPFVEDAMHERFLYPLLQGVLSPDKGAVEICLSLKWRSQELNRGFKGRDRHLQPLRVVLSYYPFRPVMGYVKVV